VPRLRSVPAQVTLAVRAPLRVMARQLCDAQTGADAVEDVVELFLFRGPECAREELVCPFRVIDEHVEDVALGPVRDLLAALCLDRSVDAADARERCVGGGRVGENDLLRVGSSREEAADRVVGQLAGEEEPVDSAVECELRCSSREDQEDHVAVAPDLADDGAMTHERFCRAGVCARAFACSAEGGKCGRRDRRHRRVSAASAVVQSTLRAKVPQGQRGRVDAGSATTRSLVANARQARRSQA
jgi:hypothetical protein